MFNKNDPLIDSVTKVMKENQSIRDAERAVNEEFGIAGKRDLPYQFHAEYDALVEEVAKEALVGGQHKLDVNKNNRLDKDDFTKLRGMKKKPMEEGSALSSMPKTATGGNAVAGSKTQSAIGSKPMEEGKMKDIATAKAEKDRLEKMEEQQVNTAGKSDKMTSAPATATTLKPLNKPGLPKLGGMTVIQKGAMKEEAIKKERGKKVAGAILAKMRAKASVMQERMTGLAPTVQADIRKKEVAKVLAKPNPNTTAATGQQTTGAARIGMTGTKAVGAAPLSDAGKDAAVSCMRQQRSDVRTGGAPGAAAAAARPSAAPKPAAAAARPVSAAPKTIQGPGGTTATMTGKGNDAIVRNKSGTYAGSVVKGLGGGAKIQNFRAGSGKPMGGGIGGGGNK
jgi:hypothetical protein